MAHQRKIIHIDMDAFFASVEQRDTPEFRGKPLIVGGKPNARGVVAACSYEARKFGIHSAMPCSQAYRLCPSAIFVPPRFDVYREVSEQIRAVFWHYASEVEPLSLDEAYLDVSYTQDFNGSATYIAQAIKSEILSETHLVASAGISYNKFLAKIASDMDKPDGLYVIKPHEALAFISKLAIGQFHGIGPATEKKMGELGIHTGADLGGWAEQDLIEHFGKSGQHFYHIARGVDDRAVQSVRQRKSVGKETTFQQDIQSILALRDQANSLAEQVCRILKAKKLKARTLTLKVKYANFTQVTRSITHDETLDLLTIRSLLPELFNRTDAGQRAVRLIGVTVSGFETKQAEKTQRQLDLGLSDVF